MVLKGDLPIGAGFLFTLTLIKAVTSSSVSASTCMWFRQLRGGQPSWASNLLLLCLGNLIFWLLSMSQILAYQQGIIISKATVHHV